MLLHSTWRLEMEAKKMCDGRHHNLQVIYEVDAGWNEEHVVEWCEDCGAVVVRRESDNRCFGDVVKMKFPKLLYEVIGIKRKNGSWGRGREILGNKIDKWR